ncbi:hypothetical protein GO986_20435 [Deinococcus sp. HMF7620]|uniref:ArsR family transcriptional regulator n=1 Tax=Deinococcus arboris TaxID=2682977 RepID=A0A7C9HU53_9DEIO|nr:hypothetical protein [Deinococcus arboris]MVN89112.1 hypothetical protein [Deinococcus arboris]
MSPTMFTATTSTQARLLQQVACLRLLAPLCQRSLSASEVAHLARVPLKATCHYLAQLVSAGLIVVEGTRPRTGRPVKIYRAVASGFRVPFTLTSHATIRELLDRVSGEFVQEVDLHLAKLFAADLQTDLLITPDGQGHLRTTLAPQNVQPDTSLPGALSLLSRCRLTPATQRELEGRLRDLTTWLTEQAAQQRQTLEAEPCLVGLLFTPAPES